MKLLLSFPWEEPREPELFCSVATAIMGSAVVGAGATIFGASKAANAQTEASRRAMDTQMSIFDQTMANLAPFIQGGGNAFSTLQGLTGTNPGGNPLTAPLTKPFEPTMEQLAQTPGYKFTLGQGLQASQNSFAAKGLGSSGASEKGAINYAEGLAGTTFQQQFQNYLTQNAQIANMLMGQSSLGANAAAGQGQVGVATGQQVGNQLTNAGNAQAGQWLASGQAVGNAAQGVPNALLYNQLYANGAFQTNPGTGFGAAATPGQYMNNPFWQGA